jgi:hypothetical protein
MIPLIYHPAYNITAFGLEGLHPFDGRKYRRIHDAMVLSGGYLTESWRIHADSIECILTRFDRKGRSSGDR